MLGYGVQSGGPSHRPGNGSVRRLRPVPAPKPAKPYTLRGVEPSVEDLINDPVTHAIMAYDNVSPAALRALIAQVRPMLQPHRPGAVVRMKV
jgi:hypothetical protein